MSRPAKSIVYGANATALGDLAEPTRTLGSKVMDAANTVHGTIIDLEWEGVGKDGAVSRADRELAQDKRVVEGYNALANAYRDGSNTMAPMIADLTKTGQGMEADWFAVSEDWVVSDTFDYQAGKKVLMALGASEETATDRMNQLQAARGNEAKTETVSLQQRADALGQADTDTATAISNAHNDIGAAAPPLAGLSGGDQAINDLKDLQAGKATAEEKARIQAAMSTWTPEQLAALAAGKPAFMPQGQYDYLKSLMHGMDGMSVGDIDKTMKDAGLEGAMGDTLRMMGNPNVQTLAGDHGGMGQLPDQVRTLLTDDQQFTQTKLGSITGVAGPISQLNALNAMLEHGNQGLRLGSDVDRGLLSQAANLAKVMDTPHIFDPNPGLQEVTLTGDVNQTLDAMLTNASGDHQAVADFLDSAHDGHSDGAARMSAAGASHSDNQAFLDLMTHHFNPGETGQQKMFDWIGPNALAGGLEGHNAAVAADASAHLLADNSDYLGGRIPDGHGGYQGLGQYNPGLMQTMAGTLTPYLGNLVGIAMPGIDAHGITGFDNTQDMARLVKVLDSDPGAAGMINKAAAAWENHFSYEFGVTGDSPYARAAGQLTQAIQDGNHQMLDTLKENGAWDAIRAYSNGSDNWDTGKTMLSTLVGALPFGGDVNALTDILSTNYKGDILGVPGDPATLTTNQWETALKQTDNKFNNMIDGYTREFCIAQGYLDRHHDGYSQFLNVPLENGSGTVNFIDSHGRLDWEAINAHRQEFDKRYSDVIASTLPNYDSAENGYLSGTTDHTIHRWTAPMQTTPQPR